MMKSKQTTPATIDEYIARFPEDIQAILQQIRQTIRQAAPDAEERISYQMPTFYLQGNLVHFGAFKTHIGFYPTPSGIEQFNEELSAYKGSKGSVQFPLDKPMPLDLFSRIVKFRVKENLAKAAAKKKPTGKAAAAGAENNNDSSNWPQGVAKPAQRALAAAGYTRLEQLTAVTESELLELHGVGPKAIRHLQTALHAQGLSFADGE
ncbi:MAG: DUF1801 domain-containing protein [Candidatus Promineifilaceae bacterium]|nr:DUF1801 domain-containing protein [Candidatus Promineifilaceae bacterium]